MKIFMKNYFLGGQELIKEHTLILKQILFFHENTYERSNTFLKSKEGYLVPISMRCKLFPNFTYDFLIIANIMFKENNLPTINNKDNINNDINNDSFVNVYSFFLNYDFDMFGMTKNFYLEFDLNQNMIRQLKLNFCQFFCIDENKLIDQVLKEKNKIFKRYPSYNNKIHLKDLNKAYSLFQNISIKQTFNLRDENLLETYFYPLILIYDKIDKKKLMLKIPDIINIIDELGLDYDWYKRLQNFKNRLIYNNKYYEKIKESGTNTFQQEKVAKSRNKITSSFDQIKFESNLINAQQQYLEIVYSIKKLGSLSYYLVNLHEKIYDSNEQSQLTNEQNDIMNKKDSIKSIFKKLKIKTTIKYNRMNSASSVGEDILNKDGDFSPDRRKSKTKVYLSQLDKKKNSLTKGSTNFSKNYLELEENKEIESKKTIKNINNDINKDNEKEEKDEVKENNENHDKVKERNNNKKITTFFDNSEYLKRMKTQKKEKDNIEDEENSPLITKDKFNEILKKNKKRNNILIIIIFIIVVSSLIINIIKFAISIIGFEACKNVLQATIYLEMLKIDVYVMCILSITYCINENENITSLSNIHSEAKLKMKSTANHIKVLQDQINFIINNRLCSGIIDILKNEISIYNLNDDWSVYEQSVDLMEELRSLSYKIHDLQYTNDKCNITNTFYEIDNYTSEQYTEKNRGRTNSIHKIFFYFAKNTFRTYKTIFDRLSEETTSTIQELWRHYQYNLFNILISIIILLFIFMTIYIVKICYDYSYYQLLFLYYYNIEVNQLKFQYQIYYLYKTIHEFNSDSVDYFEYIKSNPNLTMSNIDITNTYSNFIKNTQNLLINNNFETNNGNNKKDNFIHTIINSISNKKSNKRNSSHNHDNNKSNNIINDKNSMNGSLLNGSMNGSSLLILNNSNNNNNQLNLNNNYRDKNSFSSNINESNNEKNNKEESIDSLLSFTRNILPSSLRLSVIFILFGIFVYFIFCISNIIILSSENNTWKYSINLSMNVLERIPNLMALLIYASLSVIRNKLNILEGSPYNDNQSEYLKYFTANSLYYSKDIMDKYFNKSYFGELLRDNLRINYNFNSYLFQETDNMFTNTIKWESLLRISGYYCINAAIGEVLSFDEDYTVYNFTEEVNYYATLCKKDNTGIDDSGAQLEIAYILEEIQTKYIEFVSYNSSNLNLTQARKNFFSSKNIKRTVIDMQLSLILYFNTISYAINLDFGIKNKIIINQQYIFSVVLIMINIIIIIGLIFSFYKNEKYKKLFGYFTEIPSTDNTDNNN